MNEANKQTKGLASTYGLDNFQTILNNMRLKGKNDKHFMLKAVLVCANTIIVQVIYRIKGIQTDEFY